MKAIAKPLKFNEKAEIYLSPEVEKIRWWSKRGKGERTLRSSRALARPLVAAFQSSLLVNCFNLSKNKSWFPVQRAQSAQETMICSCCCFNLLSIGSTCLSTVSTSCGLFQPACQLFLVVQHTKKICEHFQVGTNVF